MSEAACSLDMTSDQDQQFMSAALAEARRAEAEGEVPVGAIAVCGGQIVGAGHNQPIGLNDPTAHAEILAIRSAASHLKAYRLATVSIYVTLEPCVMCAGAIVLARIPLVVFGAPDPKAGAVISIAQLFDERGLNHHPRWRMGVLRAESEALLKEFFAGHRERSGD